MFSVRIPLIVLFVTMLVTCRQVKNQTMHSQPSMDLNQLGAEPSLYLRQHAHNPVNWFAWSDEAWEKARRENKLVLISIGYSSCHWCHVMEKESFEDPATAKIMNDHYVCIKVDREERPDIDQIYMKAVQLMTGSGGWPLNCFALPDGKPVYGGTYFPNATWKDLLDKLNKFYTTNQKQAEQYASELLLGIHRPELVSVATDNENSDPEILSKTIAHWKQHLDNINGGPDKSPKFPLPDNYKFLLRYAIKAKDETLLSHVNLTLHKMAFGGIYDQAGGGFSRYSTDTLWKVPHFEKMLYDNSQLITLYSQAYKATGDELYRDIVYETAGFLKREMRNSEGGYYSAIDADSEGEEGKYYVWTKKQLDDIKLPALRGVNTRELFDDYFSITQNGYWENENYILLRHKTDNQLSAKYNISTHQLREFTGAAKKSLLAVREKRICPGTDTKIVTSWNAMQVSALCEAYKTFGDPAFLDDAILCMKQIESNAVSSSGMLLHVDTQNGKLEAGFMEDYAFTISALINLYQVTFDENWLNKAKGFANDAIANYYDEDNGLFWYTAKSGRQLISRTKEITDNVIPSSNSEMANNLFVLGQYFDDKKYTGMSAKMLLLVQKDMIQWGSAYSNWAQLMMNFTNPYIQTVISGKDAENSRRDISKHYLPGVLLAGSNEKESLLPLLQNRYISDKTYIYVCENNTCKLPVESTEEAIRLMRR